MVISNQFSLKAMMIAMAVISVLCCIFFTLPEWVGVGILLMSGFLLLPTMLCLVACTRDNARAFALGAITPSVVLFFMFLRTDLEFLGPVSSQDALDLKIVFALGTLAVVASGFIGRAVRSRCLRNEWPTIDNQTKENADLH